MKNKSNKEKITAKQKRRKHIFPQKYRDKYNKEHKKNKNKAKPKKSWDASLHWKKEQKLLVMAPIFSKK